MCVVDRKCLYNFLLIFCVVSANLPKTLNIFHTRFPRETTVGCILPSHPDFGKWSIYNSQAEWTPGKMVPLGSVLQVFCNDNYTSSDFGLSNCMDGKWQPKIPKCLRTCPPLYNTDVLRVTCSDRNGKNKNCSRATENSCADFQCKEFYEVRDLDTRPPTMCIGGNWNNKIPNCVPICGKKRYNEPTFLINAQVVREGDYPWQAALYNGTTQKQLICGGSLLNQNVILTAAHCVVTSEGIHTKSTYVIAVGKYYRQFDEVRDFKNAQFSLVEDIFFPESYEGRIRNYKNDIALIVTKQKFVLSERVLPICIDWSSRLLEIAIKTSSYGYVSGWGYTQETGSVSDVLRELRVPLINNVLCNELLPPHFRKYLTRDKICAGYSNKSTSICKGDSGGGLVLKHDDRYYVTGVVSLGPPSPRENTASCDSQEYGLYTKISEHRNFIAEKIALADKLTLKEDESQESGSNETTEHSFIPSKNGCMLPQYPQFGQWSVNDLVKERQFVVGQFVESGTQLIIKCQDRYLLKGPSHLVCKDGIWNTTMGKCLKTCPSIFSTTTMNVRCSYRQSAFLSNGYTQNCVNATDGTFADFQCAPFYEDFALTRNPVHVCVDGKWDQTTPVCSPACGIVDNVDNKEEKLFPWHVAIYNSTSKDLLCSGSLLNEKVILTAGHCVTDSARNLNSKENFLVTVGNYYRHFNDSRDFEYIQISGLEAMFTPKSSDSTTYDGDIAILVAKRSFKLSLRVRPVCLDKLPIIGYDSKLKYYYSTGWGYDIDRAKFPDHLKNVKIPVESVGLCEEKVDPAQYNHSLFEDKICVGYVNNSSMICFGDTGAGLVFRHDDGRHYLVGTMSRTLESPNLVGVCSRQKLGVYTNTYFYTWEFILQKEAEFRPNSKKIE